MISYYNKEDRWTKPAEYSFIVIMMAPTLIALIVKSIFGSIRIFQKIKAMKKNKTHPK
jgi:hypothetical protein